MVSSVPAGEWWIDPAARAAGPPDGPPGVVEYVGPGVGDEWVRIEPGGRIDGWVRAGLLADHGLRVVYDTRPILTASAGTHDREAQITAYAGPSAGWHLWPSWACEDTQLCTFSDPTGWGGDLDVCGYIAEGDPPYHWLGAGWEREDGILGDIDDAIRWAIRTDA